MPTTTSPTKSREVFTKDEVLAFIAWLNRQISVSGDFWSEGTPDDDKFVLEAWLDGKDFAAEEDNEE